MKPLSIECPNLTCIINQSWPGWVHTVNTKGSFVGCRQGITENCQSIQLLIFNTFIDKIRVFVDFSERTANFGFEVYFFWSEFDSHNAHETQFLCQSKQIYIYIFYSTLPTADITMKGLDTVESLSVEVRDSKVANFSVLEALSSSNVAGTKSGGLYIVVY